MRGRGTGRCRSSESDACLDDSEGGLEMVFLLDGIGGGFPPVPLGGEAFLVWPGGLEGRMGEPVTRWSK